MRYRGKNTDGDAGRAAARLVGVRAFSPNRIDRTVLLVLVGLIRVLGVVTIPSAAGAAT